jgi:hypothetical protein
MERGIASAAAMKAATIEVIGLARCRVLKVLPRRALINVLPEPRLAGLAQSVEQLSCKQQVIGSIPVPGSNGVIDSPCVTVGKPLRPAERTDAPMAG